MNFSCEELGGLLDEQAAKRGLGTWRLSVALRKHHAVESVEPEWCYAEHLEARLKVATEALRKLCGQNTEAARSMAESLGHEKRVSGK
jgi:hypothetical protein